MICPALAWLVMRLAVCTLAPNTSRASSTTGPKWQPMRMATCWPSILSSACAAICFCIWPAASSASSGFGNVAMTSSPIVLITVPLCCSVAVRMTSMQIATMARARWSPSDSNRRVEPTTSANRMASSISLTMFPVTGMDGGRRPLVHISWPKPAGIIREQLLQTTTNTR